MIGKKIYYQKKKDSWEKKLQVRKFFSFRDTKIEMIGKIITKTRLKKRKEIWDIQKWQLRKEKKPLLFQLKEIK